jgi:hypothetical protein
MDSTRLEILKNGNLIPLKLNENEPISYNAVLNRIGKVDSREISGSNTFPIPWIHQNIKALDLNIFNAADLADALNKKYEALYYKNDLIFKKGFVVINNMKDGIININFISQALVITSQWGSTTYKQLLDDDDMPRSIEMRNAILEMREYNLPRDAVATPLSNITGKTYPLSLFPNNLNQIGDQFQICDGGERENNSFNPYQSRPIFNAKAFMELACESYSFTPIFDESIDWTVIDKTYMVTDGLDKSQYSEVSLDVSIYSNEMTFTDGNLSYLDPSTGDWQIAGLAAFPEEIQQDGNEFLFHPLVDDANVGIMEFKVTSAPSPVGYYSKIQARTVYTQSGSSLPLITEIGFSENSNILSLDKSLLNTVPAGGIEFLGIQVMCVFGGYSNGNEKPFFVQTSESYFPEGAIAYDEQKQFVPEDIDLTYAASNETISSLMNGLMQKQGMLMDVNVDKKEVYFFSYLKYKTQKLNGVYRDWSKYLLEHNNPKFNTNYGNNYAILNKIGLSSPYPGNFTSIILGTQYANLSKFKEYQENFVKQFKDVKSVVKILHTASPYTEYGTSGASLVALDDNTTIGNLTQIRYDKSTQGTLTNLTPIHNVNYFQTPDGVFEWYSLIDTSIKCEPSLLLPLDEIINLDLSIPVYLEQLGGYYIIEEVKEYIDSKTIVKVSLIKLPGDPYTEPVVIPDSGPNEASINYSVQAVPPNPIMFEVAWRAVYTVSFAHYTPTAATWHLEKVDEFGVDLGPVINQAVDLTTGTGFVYFDFTGVDNGTYRTYISDDVSGLRSEEITINIGVTPPTEFITLMKTNGGEDFWNSEGQYDVTFTGFTPTNATQIIQEFNITTQLNVGSPITSSITNGNASHTANFVPLSQGAYKVSVSADGYVSNHVSWIYAI